jgi:hypothetical protein
MLATQKAKYSETLTPPNKEPHTTVQPRVLLPHRRSCGGPHHHWLCPARKNIKSPQTPSGPFHNLFNAQNKKQRILPATFKSHLGLRSIAHPCGIASLHCPKDFRVSRSTLPSSDILVRVPPSTSTMCDLVENATSDEILSAVPIECPVCGTAGVSGATCPGCGNGISLAMSSR